MKLSGRGQNVPTHRPQSPLSAAAPRRVVEHGLSGDLIRTNWTFELVAGWLLMAKWAIISKPIGWKKVEYDGGIETS